MERPQAVPPAQPVTRAPMGPSGASWSGVAPLLVDLLLVGLDGAIVFYLRFSSGGHLGDRIGAGHYLGFLGIYALLVGVFCQNQGLYRAERTFGPLDESFSVLNAVFFATLFLITFIYLSGDKSISRLVVGFTGVLTAVTLPAWRFWKREIDKQRVMNGQDGRNVLIVGAKEVGQALARYFDENKYLGYVVKGFLDRDPSGDPRFLGSVGELPRLALTHFVDEIFITTPSDRELVADVVLEARRRHLAVNVVPEMFDGLGLWVPVRQIGGFPVMQLFREPIPGFGLFVKRAVDVLGAAAGLVLLAPLLALLAVAIKLDSSGPAIYSSCRVGKKGYRFRCYKLRTMVANADAQKDGLRNLNEREGPFFKMENDPRLTRIGGFLRRYSFDELPQLWNVFRGDMSLVGPRPHPLDDYERYQIEHLRRLDVKPGITGLWQVYARRDPSFERNLSLDLEYIENWSLWLDTKILLKTLPAALAGSGR
ncbi:MAG TPA: sugar transferase [Patescibacteria group bacterium]|nr:sugar transferase [Patescibacteria group bacterium]